jgi:hypothetical protein
MLDAMGHWVIPFGLSEGRAVVSAERNDKKESFMSENIKGQATCRTQRFILKPPLRKIIYLKLCCFL